ncbi:MAG: hypothetical protein ACM3TN_19105 [Alphaproteobacteria bacterium]
MAVACGILIAARQALTDARHHAAFAAGGKAITRERALADKHKKEWRDVKQRRRKGEKVKAPKREHAFPPRYDAENMWREYKGQKPINEYRSYRIRPATRKAGKHGYDATVDKMRRSPAPDLTLNLSPYALLKFGGLSRTPANMQKLERALSRLQQTCGDLGPLVLSVRVVPFGRTRVRVSGKWLAPPFGKVPMPLPTRSRVACSLYLFLQTIRHGSSIRSSISLEALAQRLGIDTNVRWIAQQSLERALATVNQHLRKLHETGMPATSYELDRAKALNGRCRFIKEGDDIDEVDTDDVVDDDAVDEIEDDAEKTNNDAFYNELDRRRRALWIG